MSRILSGFTSNRSAAFLPFLRRSRLALVLVCSPALYSAEASKDIPTAELKSAAPTVLFIGNSFLFGARSAVRFYHTDLVTDLNREGQGGVPALFKSFTQQAGKNLDVNLETAPGKGIDYHLKEKAELIGSRPWDQVVMLGYSTLDRYHPGDPKLLIRTVKQMAELLHGKNPNADIRLIATWSRADQVYPKLGHWNGQPIEKMAIDVRRAYDQAAEASGFVRGVIPVGEAWNLAIKTGLADPNPYDGITFEQIDLWTYDHYHASNFGYYLEALTIFGALTGLDPRSLGKDETCAFELGFSIEQARTLQKIAFEELSLNNPHAELKSFSRVGPKRPVETAP